MLNSSKLEAKKTFGQQVKEQAGPLRKQMESVKAYNHAMQTAWWLVEVRACMLTPIASIHIVLFYPYCSCLLTCSLVSLLVKSVLS